MEPLPEEPSSKENHTSSVLVKTVKLSSKGQVTLPADALRALKLKKGAEFILIQDGARILLVPAGEAGKALLGELGGWEALALPAFEELWDNDADEVWDEA